jgi:Fic family protein
MYVAKPPTVAEIFEKLQDPGKALDSYIKISAEGPSSKGYLDWDKMRHLEPPEGLTHEEWWLSLKLSRGLLKRQLPMTDSAGNPFFYVMTDEVLRLLHHVDKRCSGEIAIPEVASDDEQARQHYLVNSLMEEAIRSSQLEGAATTRRVAKELIRSGRPPKDRSERMIVNNYRALQFMRDDIGSQLTPETVLELQRVLTEGTLDNPDSAGRLQTNQNDRVAVVDTVDDTVLHRPPPADQLPQRLAAMCTFANQEDTGGYMHPVIKAVLLHFWLAHDHPFEDGNGRTARALFYWSMRTRGYWLTEYLSISKILREAPSQYSKAFLLTETDEGDTTYFILYQLEVVKRAVEQLDKYLQKKVREIRQVERLLRRSEEFNHRQLSLLSDALRNPGGMYTFGSHAASHNVTHETSRRDLLSLQKAGLLRRSRSRKKYIYSPSPDLADRLAHLNDETTSKTAGPDA